MAQPESWSQVRALIAHIGFTHVLLLFPSFSLLLLSTTLKFNMFFHTSGAAPLSALPRLGEVGPQGEGQDSSSSGTHFDFTYALEHLQEEEPETDRWAVQSASMRLSVKYIEQDKRQAFFVR